MRWKPNLTLDEMMFNQSLLMLLNNVTLTSSNNKKIL